MNYKNRLVETKVPSFRLINHEKCIWSFKFFGNRSERSL